MYQLFANMRSENTPFCISDALINSVKGNIDNGLFSGSKLDKITEIVTVKSIIKK